MATLSIAGTAYNFNEWPDCNVSSSIRWAKAKSGNWYASDRGAAQDIYETSLSIFDTELNIMALRVKLNANREIVTLSSFSIPVFSPNVDHTGTIGAVVVDYGKNTHRRWAAYPNQGMYELEIKIRAISPTILSTTPSISSLRLQEGFDAGHTWSANKSFSYSQAVNYEDERTDLGFFNPTYRQTTAEAQAILRYILFTARGNPVVFPNHSSVTFPFGEELGSGPFNCIIKDFSIKRFDLSFWDITIDWVVRA